MLNIVIEAISEQLSLTGEEIASITENTRLREDLSIDSLEAVEIAMLLEDKLKIILEENDMDDVVTVGDLVSVIEKIQA